MCHHDRLELGASSRELSVLSRPKPRDEISRKTGAARRDDERSFGRPLPTRVGVGIVTVKAGPFAGAARNIFILLSARIQSERGSYYRVFTKHRRRTLSGQGTTPETVRPGKCKDAGPRNRNGRVDLNPVRRQQGPGS